jgi:D-glycero-D-manno-heptose 1,7-bisphosphate phosphatase
MILPNEVNANTTLFLDRDGVINVRPIDSYVFTPDEFVFIDGVLEAIAVFSKIFSHIIVVTNQQGIGKNLMTMDDAKRIHYFMMDEITKAGGRVDRVFVAPQLKHEQSNMRKPNIGMGLKAKEYFPTIDFENSVMVGDTVSDISFGKRLKMTTVAVGTEYKHVFNLSHADYCFDSLLTMSKIFI